MEQPSTTESYFSGYNDVHIHELMLKDRPRTLAYKSFIDKNQSLFRDKVIIDVGAGTGILSLFVAAAGAKKVYAIEASDIANICDSIVEINGYKNVIDVIHDSVENTDKLSGVEADVIISEWMGFCLLNESMLDTVLTARDRWLKSDGLMLPSLARLYMCPVNMDGFYKEKFEFWKDVYGFNFTPVVPSIASSTLHQPLVTDVKPDDLMTEPVEVMSFNLKTVKVEEVQCFTSDLHEFECHNNCKIHGFACWFEVIFTPDSDAYQKLDDFQARNNSSVEILKNYGSFHKSVSMHKETGVKIVDVFENTDDIVATSSSCTPERTLPVNAIHCMGSDDTDDKVVDTCIIEQSNVNKSKLDESNDVITSGNSITKRNASSEIPHPSSQQTRQHVMDVLQHHKITPSNTASETPPNAVSQIPPNTSEAQENSTSKIHTEADTASAPRNSTSEIPVNTTLTTHTNTTSESPHNGPITPEILSTSPGSAPTHWKQTVVMLPSPLLVEPDDTIRVTLEMTQSEGNKRHYDISVLLHDIELPSGPESEPDDLDTEDHPMPCSCDAPRCRIIKAIMDKYDEQDKQLCEENEPNITCAEINAVDEGYDDINADGGVDS